MRLCDHTRPSLMRFFARQNVNDFILRVKSNSGRFDRMAQDDAFLRPATSRFPADHDLRRSICEFSDAGNNQIPKVGQDCEWRPVRCPAQAARPLFSVRGLSGARSLRAYGLHATANPNKYSDELLDAYVFIEDADALYAEYAARGVEFTRGLANMPWHSREFVVKDCDGRLLAFGANL
jgi:hypothetical protein